eukprot:4485087-Amphidinium_carterae.2
MANVRSYSWMSMYEDCGTPKRGNRAPMVTLEQVGNATYVRAQSDLDSICQGTDEFLFLMSSGGGEARFHASIT